jgi:phosphoribosylformylglycinamidine (FGAM) synthase-like amidotransferase family enzyme
VERRVPCNGMHAHVTKFRKDGSMQKNGGIKKNKGVVVVMMPP